jgi:hypothetical protein
MDASHGLFEQAAECEQWAKLSLDPKSRADWKIMAERWRRCADLAHAQSFAAHSRAREKMRRCFSQLAVK